MKNYLVLGSNYLRALKDIQAKGGGTSHLSDSMIDTMGNNEEMLTQTMAITDGLVIAGNLVERLQGIISEWSELYNKPLYIWASK